MKSKVLKHIKDFSPSTILIMLKVSLAIMAIVIFMQLTFSVNSGSEILQFDESILKWIETIRTPFWNMMMLDITALGGLGISLVMILLAIALFILSNDFAAAIHLVITSIGAYNLAIWSKSIISRQRPSIIPQLIEAHGMSYPSGHSILSSSIFLTLGILACRHYRGYQKRIMILILTGLMITLVSFSRLYLGVHYPSDTLSGAMVGISWSLILAALFSKYHFKTSNF